MRNVDSHASCGASPIDLARLSSHQHRGGLARRGAPGAPRDSSRPGQDAHGGTEPLWRVRVVRGPRAVGLTMGGVEGPHDDTGDSVPSHDACALCGQHPRGHDSAREPRRCARRGPRRAADPRGHCRRPPREDARPAVAHHSALAGPWTCVKKSTPRPSSPSTQTTPPHPPPARTPPLPLVARTWRSSWHEPSTETLRFF